MEFHHRSCSSAIGALNSPALVLMTSLSPPTQPICTAGTPSNFARSTTFTASSAWQVMTTRLCVSPNSRASNLHVAASRKSAADLI